MTNLERVNPKESWPFLKKASGLRLASAGSPTGRFGVYLSFHREQVASYSGLAGRDCEEDANFRGSLT